ncbi:MAG: hypothetical protein LBB34_04180 [Holosporales bacterium]|nr:hypothetical protein [Holosporales bacterium]
MFILVVSAWQVNVIVYAGLVFILLFVSKFDNLGYISRILNHIDFHKVSKSCYPVFLSSFCVTCLPFCGKKIEEMA